jgi:hypothetical protein
MHELQVLEEKCVNELGAMDEALIELRDLHLALVGGGDANVVWA